MDPITKPPSRRACLRAALGSALICARPLRAQVVAEGHTYAAQITLAGSTLQLNGVGYRAVAWFKGYAAGLYLARKAGNAEAAGATPGPKRLQLVMLVDVPAAEFVKAFYKGIARNTPAAQQPALAERMRRFDALVSAIGTVRKRDVVDLDWLPDSGLRLARNGRELGAPIAGEDFYTALLRIFVGPRPVDPEMKIGLLGGPVG